MAGALGIRLGGPRAYDGEKMEAPWFGDGRAETTAGDIRTALGLYRRACAVQMIVLGLLAVLTLI